MSIYKCDKHMGGGVNRHAGPSQNKRLLLGPPDWPLSRWGPLGPLRLWWRLLGGVRPGAAAIALLGLASISEPRALPHLLGRHAAKSVKFLHFWRHAARSHGARIPNSRISDGI